MNALVEAGGGYDLATQQELDASERWQRGAAGVAALAGMPPAD